MCENGNHKKGRLVCIGYDNLDLEEEFRMRKNISEKWVKRHEEAVEKNNLEKSSNEFMGC